MATEKIIKYTITIAGIALGLFLFPFALKIFAPFALAFLVAIPCQKFLRFLEKRFGMSRGIGSALIATLIVFLGAALVVVSGYQLFIQAKNILTSLPDAIRTATVWFDSASGKFSGIAKGLPKEASGFVDEFIQTLKTRAGDIAQTAAAKALSLAGGLARALPKIALFFAMFILGTFFFLKDYKLIINFLHESLPKKAVEKLRAIKQFFLIGFTAYLKAQLILMGMTFILVTVCLWIVGDQNAFLLGLLCGLVDALPFLGTAVILVPRGIFAFLHGDIKMVISIAIIQIIVFIFRQIAEPKVVSRQIGIHPILTLISVYVGLRFFGVIGMILAPIFTLLLVNLYVSYKENSSQFHSL